MIEIEVENWSGDVGEAVTDAANKLGLTISTDGCLKCYPGSRHWHLKRGKATGTLEITFWPAQNRLWVTYHDNRIGDGWVVETAPHMAGALARKLSGL